MIYSINEEFAIQADMNDPLSKFRREFLFPTGPDGREQTYFCGHSLGLQPRKTREYLDEVMDSWESRGVRGHFQGEFPWLPYHEFLQDKTARLLGAAGHEVITMNSLTTNLHLMMVSFYRPDKKRNKILIEQHAFPSDHYAAETQISWHGFDPEECLITVRPDQGELISDQAWYDALDEFKDSVALVLLPGVQYYTGQAFPMEKIAAYARNYGAVTGVDLAHAAGNLPLHLNRWNIDFAVWCHYKYMNSGPGAVGGCFVHEKHGRNQHLPRFAGWWGHSKETRFAMKPGFNPIPTAEGWQLSNPPIVSLAAIRSSLDVFHQAGGMEPLRERSVRLTGYLEFLLEEMAGKYTEQITSRDPQERGAQISFRLIHPRCTTKKLRDLLEEKGIVTDWRDPDVMRVAPVPLYNSFLDIYRLVSTVKEQLDGV